MLAFGQANKRSTVQAPEPSRAVAKAGGVPLSTNSLNALFRDVPRDDAKHRAYIDGLRGLAILLVIAYHALPWAAPSGYVGVDIFFVISGFVITLLILREIAGGGFSLLGFLARRARRLLPAAVLVYVAVAVIGYYILLPDTFMNFGQSLTGASFLYANMVFYRMVDYFSQPAHQTLLLHTWSLSVEEQFYLVFPPLLLVLVPRLPRTRLVAVLAVALIAMFVYAQWIFARDPNMAFYGLHARAWEFLIGALLAAGVERVRMSPATAETAAFGGLGLILASAFVGGLAGIGTRVPVLMACTGVALAIAACHSHRTVASRLLSSRAAVFVGLISYSLYLWHWPLLSATHYLEDAPPSGLTLVLLLFATFALSICAWLFVEQPFRAARISDYKTLCASVATMAVLAAAGFGIVKANGLPARLDEPAQAIYRSKVQSPLRPTCDGLINAFANDATCNIGRLKEPGASFDVAIMGDSNADHLVPGFDKLLKERGLSGRQITQNQCIPALGLLVGLNRSKNKLQICEHLHEAMLRFVRENPGLKLIVLASYWPPSVTTLVAGRINEPAVRPATMRTSPFPDLFEDRLRATVEFFTKRGIKVLLIGKVPDLIGQIPLRCAVKARREGRGGEECGIPLAHTVSEIEAIDAILARVAGSMAGVSVVYPAATLCSATRCSAMKDGDLLYFDHNHLNVVGSVYMSRFIKIPVL